MSDPPEWKRPHPLTVVVLIGTFLANNAFYVVLVVGFGQGGFGIEAFAFIASAATVGLGALGWFMTTYAITDEAVWSRHGILKRQSRTISLDRIQQVSISEPVLARAVGLAVVQVTEASADGDIEIRYLGKPVATEMTERLRELARRRDTLPPAAAGAAASALPPPPERPETIVHEGSLQNLLLFQAAVIAPVLIIGAVLTVAIAAVTAFTADITAAILVLVAGLGVMLLLPALVLVGAALNHGKFILRRGSRSLTVEAGLLSRRQVEVRPDRVQTLTVSSGPLARAAGLCEVRFSAATGQARDQQQLVHLAPAAAADQVPAIIQGSVDLDDATGVELERVSRVTIRRQLFRALIAFLFVGMPLVVAAYTAHPLVAAVVLLAWWLSAVAYARARYSRLGFALDAGRLVSQRGVLLQQLTQLSLTNIQSVSTQASFFQRRLGVADMIVATAGVGPANHVRIPDLDTARAGELRGQLFDAAAASVWELRT